MRQFLIVAMMALQFPVNAQAPAKYRYVTTSPGSYAYLRDTATGESRPVIVRDNRATSLVSVTSHDSAGGTIWQLAVDSTVNDQVIRDSVYGKLAPPPMPSIFPPPTGPVAPLLYQIVVQSGRPITTSLGRTTQSKPEPLDSLNPSINLLLRWPGLGLLIPSPALPGNVGGARTDTLITHTVNEYRRDTTRTNPKTGQIVNYPGSPASDVYDTTLVRWRRTSTDTLDASVVRTTVSIVGRSDGLSMVTVLPTLAQSHRATTTGTYRLVYDGQQGIREIECDLSTVTGGMGPSRNGLVPSIQKYTLVRVP